ncbi:MAG: hypothetical protein ACOZQL_03935 [Myxococcota bacterium]
MRRWCTLAWLLTALLSWAEEPSVPRVRFALEARGAADQASGKGPFEDAAHGSTPPTLAEIEAGQRAVLRFLETRGPGPLGIADTLRLYAAAGRGGHHSVHALLGRAQGQGIDEATSLQLGAARSQFQTEVLDELARRVREKTKQSGLGVNDFGASTNPAKQTAATDIDFTLYPLSEDVKASWLVEEYQRLFRELSRTRYGVEVSASQLDIVAHRYDATIPDWRQQHSVSDFVVRLRTGRSLLKANREAYFLEGAFVQQVMRRSVTAKEPTFTWLSTDERGAVTRSPTHAADVPLYFYRPEVKPRHAFGAAVGNLHMWNLHEGDLVLEAKYLLRSLDEGVGRLLANKRAPFVELDADQRGTVLGALYASPSLGLSGKTREKLLAAYEVARLVRLAHDRHQTLTDAQALAPLVDFLRRTAGPELKLDDAWAVKEARALFTRACRLALLSNVVLSAEPRFKDWYAPERTERVTVIDEDGTERRVEATAEQLEKLQFAAFFEVRDSLEVLDEPARRALKQKLAESNPRLRADVEIVERLIAKQREATLPGDDDAERALSHREQAANEVLSAWDALAKDSTARGWRRVSERAGKTLATGNALEDYAQTRMVDALQFAAGERLGVHLDAFRRATADTNQHLLGPVWMSRITKANSVATVLTVWVKEGQLNAKVLETAALETVSNAPILGLVVSISGGGAGAVAQIALTQTIPGYGQVVLVLGSARGVVELGGALLFEPLKRDKVKLAYEGGGNTARPSLLAPLDPAGRLTLQQRRQAVYDWFRPRLVEAFQRRYGGGAEPAEMPASFAGLESELLPVVMGKHVGDWWNATGPFASADVNAVRRMMEEAWSDELRAQLVRQLISDYVDEKKRRFEAAEAQHARNLELLAQAARRDEVAGEEWRLAQPTARAAHGVMADLARGALQQEAPVIEPRLELRAAPLVRLAKDSRGASRLLVEEVGVRAKLLASGTTEHPEPFRVQWRLDGQPVAESAVQKSEGDPERAPASVTVVAEALDANGRLVTSARVVLPLEAGPARTGEDVCEAPATVADALHCLEQAALEARQLEQAAAAKCAEAADHVREADGARRAAEAGLESWRARLELAEARGARLDGLKRELTTADAEIDRAGLALAALVTEAEQVSRELCALSGPTKVPPLRARLQALAERARREGQASGAALLDTEGTSRELEVVARELHALEQATPVAADQRTLLARLEDARVDLRATGDRRAALDALAVRARASHAAARRLTPPPTNDEERKLADWLARVDEAATRDRECGARVESSVTRLEREGQRLTSELERLEPRRSAALGRLDAIPPLRAKADESVAAATRAEALAARVQALLTEGSNCATRAENTQPTEAELVELLSRTDCSRLPGSVAGYDPRRRAVLCVCPPGAALHVSGRACLSCTAADQACRAALTAGDLQRALQITTEAAACEFAPLARQVVERSLAQQRELACLRAETAVYEDLNARRLESAVQRLQRVQAAGCRVNPQTVQDVRSAIELRRRSEQAAREQAMWNQLLRNMNDVLRQMNQPPPPPVSVTPPPSRPSTQPTPPATTPPPRVTTPPRPGGARPSVDCEKKFCPVCGNDDLVMLGESSDAQCMNCKQQYAQQIADCNAGGRAADQPGRTLSQFRDHFVVRCVRAGQTTPMFRVKGPSAPALPSNESCTVVGDACTLTECGFAAERMNAQR